MFREGEAPAEPLAPIGIPHVHGSAGASPFRGCPEAHFETGTGTPVVAESAGQISRSSGGSSGFEATFLVPQRRDFRTLRVPLRSPEQVPSVLLGGIILEEPSSPYLRAARSSR